MSVVICQNASGLVKLEVNPMVFIADDLRQELHEWLTEFADGFFGNDVRIRSIVFGTVRRCVSNAIETKSKGRGSPNPFKKVWKRLDSSKSMWERSKIDVSSGPISGLRCPAWAIRAQKGRFVSDRRITEMTQGIVEEIWSYLTEFVHIVRFYEEPLSEDVYSCSEIRYRIRQKKDFGPERNKTGSARFLTRDILRMAAYAAIEEKSHHEKRSSRKTDVDFTSPESQYLVREMVSLTSDSPSELIASIVADAYPLHRAENQETVSDRKKRLNQNANVEQRRNAYVDRLDRIIGNYTEGLPLSECDQKWMERFRDVVLSRGIEKPSFDKPQNVRTDCCGSDVRKVDFIEQSQYKELSLFRYDFEIISRGYAGNYLCQDFNNDLRSWMTIFAR